MKICLDLRYKTKSGGSTYIHHVTPLILKLDRKNRYVLLKFSHHNFNCEERADAVISSPSCSDFLRILWDIFVLPFHLKKHKIEVLHSMKFSSGCWIKVKKIMTRHSIYDQVNFPISWKMRLYNALFNSAVLRRAEKVITVSDYVKEEVETQYGIHRQKIITIYHGIDASDTQLEANEIAAFKKRMGLGNYLLCLGNVFPVKNHLTIVRALAQVLSKYPETQLVIAGSLNHPYARLVTREIENLDLKNQVKLLGFVCGEEVVRLLNGAKMLLIPSLTEGFGIAMLEAFRCGLPVIAAKRGSLAELGEGCCLFVEDPMDNKAFAKQIMRLLEAPSLAEELRNKALQKAGQFTWEQSAKKHIEVYESLNERSIGVQ